MNGLLFLSYPGKNSVYSLWMSVSQCSDLSLLVLVKLPLQCLCMFVHACAGILTFSYKIPRSGRMAFVQLGGF